MDSEIRRAVRADPDAARIGTEDWFRRAKLVEPQPKHAVSIRLDEDVLKWFKRPGRGYQTRINAVLRAYVNSQTGSPIVRNSSGRVVPTGRPKST